MSSCKWTILQSRCTIPTSHKSTMYGSRIHKEQSRNSAVFPINISHTTCIYTHYNHIKPFDSHFNPCHARIGCCNDLPHEVTRSTLFQQTFHILKLPPACSAMSRHFHLYPHYKDYMVTMYISLDRVNLSAINISTQIAA